MAIRETCDHVGHGVRAVDARHTSQPQGRVSDVHL
jgi:hypothetical protein